MYLLIVEDEKNTREAIRDIMCWEKIGITHVDCAADGIEALEKIQKQRPDILLCDIRMPRMDGISLVTSIREYSYPIHVVYLSAYSDKKYLKAAIQFNVVGYVEKPVDIFELEEMLIKAVRKCTREKKSSLEWTEGELIRALIREGEVSEEVEKYVNKQYPVDPYNGYYCFGYILFFQGVSVSDKSFMDLFGNCLRAHYSCFLLSDSDANYWRVVLSSNSPADLGRCCHNAFFDELCCHIKASLGDNINPAMIIGSAVQGLKNVKLSYHDVQLHLEDVFFGGYGRLYPLLELRTLQPGWIDEKVVQFSFIVDEMKYEAILPFIEAIQKDLQNISLQKTGVIQNFYFQILLMIWRSFSKVYPEVFPSSTNSDWLNDINNFCTLEEVHMYVNSEIEHIMSTLECYKDLSGPVYHIVKYLESHYSDEINMSVLSETVNFTPNYLSTIFKKETGCSIRQYLTTIRIQQAKKYLRYQNLSLLDISQKVGFDDYSYFSKVFKKIEGLGPNEYKEKKL